MMSPSKVMTLAACLLVCHHALSQVRPDSTAVLSIDSVAVVTSTVRTSGISGDLASGLDIRMETLQTFPRMLGTADPLKFAQALPGVTTNSEWQSGLNIQGCEVSQSVMTLCGVPVYGQGRILGLFSVFNPGHFKKIRFGTSTSSRRLGGELCLDTADTLSRAFHGEGNVGPVSTHATLSFPVGDRTSLTLSGRRSFIDIFYKGLLKMDGAEMDYRFFDANASLLYVPDVSNTIDVNAYCGLDRGGVNAGIASTMLGAEWGNAVANVRWRHHGEGLDITAQAYGSAYTMHGDMMLTANAGSADDRILDVGVQGTARWRDWEFAAEADWYDIQPQAIRDRSSSSPGSSDIPGQRAVLSTMRSSYSLRAGDFTLRPGLAASLYSDISDGGRFPGLDPELFIGYGFHRGGRLSLDAGYRHQYLFMTGMTDSGFPVEFWLGSGRYSKPQSSLYGTVAYDVNFLRDAFTLNVQAYGKRLWNMVEYSGFMSEVLGGRYDLRGMLLPAEGWNYGSSVQLSKNSGLLTGWVSYSWGRALRRFDDPALPGIYPSSHERPHELNAVASCKLGRWDLGGNFILASGLPYTPATSVFCLDERLLVKYGERNSGRLSAYIRLDLSAGFNIRTRGRFRDGVNVSVQNVTARRNQMTAMLKVRDGQYSYAPTQLVIPVLPSVNYYCNF